MSGQRIALAITAVSICLWLGSTAAKEWWDATEQPPTTKTAAEPGWWAIRHPSYNGFAFFSRPELGAILWDVRGEESLMLRQDPFQISCWRVLLDPTNTHRSLGTTVDAIPTGGGRFVLLPHR